MTAKKRRIISKALYALGLAVAVLPPVIAFIERFPVLKEKNYEQLVSWVSVLVLTVCCIPLWRKLKELFKSPDITLLWTAVFIVFSAVRGIIDGMIVVAFCGLCGNLLAKALFIASKKIESKERVSADEQ